MSGTGINYRDLVPVPEKTEVEQAEKSYPLGEGPTASHHLATADHDEKGLTQLGHTLEVKNLGWNEPKEKIPAPLLGGIDNEELWLLIRRFDKQTYHLKETIAPVPGNLDLNVADEDEFSPDKLRSTVERLYMTIGIGLLGFVKHMVRLRSWREQQRTSFFAAAYAVAWLLDMLVPLFAATLIVLIAYPPARRILFPPAPIALVNSKDGSVQKPKAGVLGSTDSATGAPENHKGEAVEAEAQNFVNGIAHVALSSATGKHPSDELPPGNSGADDSVPDPTATALTAADAQASASGKPTSAHQDKSKVPMQAAMWAQMRPLMHGITDTADTWERFANMLSPTPPFPRDGPRFRLAAIVVPLLAVSLLVSSYMFVKSVTFGIGFGFFGDPIITPALHWVNSNYPNWKKLLEVRNTILKGVPTNAQLTITLLRIGEANKAPVPPPPVAKKAPPEEAIDITNDRLASAEEDAPLGASDAEIREAALPDPGPTEMSSNGTDIDESSKNKHGGKAHKLLGAVKTSVKASVETALGANKVKAEVGSQVAKERVGVTSRKNFEHLTGPVDFKARCDGKKGYVYISTKATIPCVSFTTDHTVEKIGSQERDDLHPVWSIAIADIKELKKLGGFSWKMKLVVGWSLDRTVADGLEIIDRLGNVYTVTAVPLRDELFNRLCSMGGQKWEAW